MIINITLGFHESFKPQFFATHALFLILIMLKRIYHILINTIPSSDCAFLSAKRTLLPHYT